jgi:hypothetical protein
MFFCSCEKLWKNYFASAAQPLLHDSRTFLGFNRWVGALAAGGTQSLSNKERSR